MSHKDDEEELVNVAREFVTREEFESGEGLVTIEVDLDTDVYQQIIELVGDDEYEISKFIHEALYDYVKYYRGIMNDKENPS